MTSLPRHMCMLSCAALLALICTACGAPPAATTSPAASDPPTPVASDPPSPTPAPVPPSPSGSTHTTEPSGELPPAPDALTQPRALAADCNTTSWTWPFCDIPWPSVPRFKVSGGRPDLTPKNSPWCTSRYIKGGGNSGYTYWLLTQNTKYKLRLWPDYYSRYDEAIYWDGRAWQWLPVSRDYPHIIMGQRVNCDA